MARLSKLTRIQRLTLVLFIIVVVNAISVSTTGYAIAGGDVLTVLLIVCLILFAISGVRPLMRRLLKRGRS